MAPQDGGPEIAIDPDPTSVGTPSTVTITGVTYPQTLTITYTGTAGPPTIEITSDAGATITPPAGCTGMKFTGGGAPALWVVVEQ